MKKVPVPNTAGYPDKDIDRNDVTMFGRYLPGTETKVHKTKRGVGAAKRGLKFHEVIGHK